MAEISLADLIKAKTESTPEAATVEPQEVIAAITDQVEEISPEERAKIDSIKEKINLMDSNTALQYGVGAQKNIAEFSDSILNNVRTKDSGYVGELLGDLVTRIKGFDADGSRDSFWKKLPIISNRSAISTSPRACSIRKCCRSIPKRSSIKYRAECCRT